jgi:hypothetical protein
MTTEGIEAVFLETHNWGKSARFFQGLGYEIEFATDHNSGQLRSGDGPYLFIEPDSSVEVVSGWEDTHWGTRLMTVRDPDGREWKLQAPK